MKFSWGWLRDHLQANDVKVVDTLPTLGFPIENCHNPLLGKYFVVAQIIDIAPHPNADRLQVCSVSDGHNTHQIVCGDPAIRVGQITALALPGAVLPDGTKIKQSKIRGTESAGMLCGACEIGLLDAGSGVVDLVAYVGSGLDIQLGVSADEILHPDGPEWTIEVTFNRGDVLSLRGVAREIAAYHTGNSLDGAELRNCTDHECKAVHNPPNPHLHNQLSPEVCQAIVTCQVRLQDDMRTPNWMQRRLHLQGIAPKLWPVDITNYVAHDLGHPLHAFDAKKVQGVLVARLSVEGEQIELLSGETITLHSGVPIFADSFGPVSIIGVMGGTRTACDSTTRTVLLEASCLDRDYFCAHRPAVEGHACKLFVRGVSARGAYSAVLHALQLLGDGATKSDVQMTGAIPTESEVSIDHSYINQLVGEEIPIRSSLSALGFTPVNTNNTSSRWRIPHWRHYDVSAQEDVAEEVARIYGYNKLATHNIQYAQALARDDCIQQLRQLLAAHGLHEVMHSSLVSDTHAKCAHNVPLQGSTKQLRSSLLPQLYDTYKLQHSRRVSQWRGIFEIGSCFSRNCPHSDCTGSDHTSDGDYTVNQSRMMGILLNSATNKSIDKYLELILSALQVQVTHSKRSAPCFAHPNIGYTFTATDNSGIYGWIGTLHPQHTYPDTPHNLAALELHVPTDYTQAVMDTDTTKTCGQSSRDLTFTFDGHPRDLYSALKTHRQPNSDVAFLAHYKDRITLRVWISLPDATQKDIDGIVEKYTKAARDCGAELT